MKLTTTARCGRTPAVLLALEELALPYELEVVADGTFLERYGRLGPTLQDGELLLFEQNAIVRHLARGHAGSPLAPASEAEACALDQWMDFSLSHLRPPLGRLRESMTTGGPGAGSPPPELLAPVKRALGVLDQALSGKEYLLGRFTFADCAFAGLEALAMLGPIFSGVPSLKAYVERLAARPASERARSRRPV